MKKTLLTVIVASLLFSACMMGERAASTSQDRVSNVEFASSAPNPAATAPNGGGGGGREPQASLTNQPASTDQTTSSPTKPEPTERKIIRNAEMSLESENPEQAQQQITSIAESKGGFVVESQQSSSDVRSTTRDTVTMTVRVPAEKFAETLEEIRKTADRIVVETVKGQDVTEEFIDIEAQLRAKRALEAQFMDIMKRAATVEDALSVQRQLAEVRGEIERIEGRKRFLENQSALSTIKVRLQTAKVFASSSDGFWDRLSDSVGNGLDIALNFVLGLVTLVIGLLPFALLVGIPSFLIGRSLMRRRSRRKSVSEIAKEEIKND